MFSGRFLAAFHDCSALECSVSSMKCVDKINFIVVCGFCCRFILSILVPCTFCSRLLVFNLTYHVVFARVITAFYDYTTLMFL